MGDLAGAGVGGDDCTEVRRQPEGRSDRGYSIEPVRPSSHLRRTASVSLLDPPSLDSRSDAYSSRGWLRALLNASISFQ
jgi:hypothetical protein